MRSAARAIQLLLICMVAGLQPASAQQVTIATLADPTLDPHFVYISNNVAFWRHFTTTLTMHDDAKGTVPNLAAAWTAPDDHTWDIQLRTDAKFRDGTPISADDVVFSLGRVGSIPGNPSPYTPSMQAIVGFEALSPTTVRIHTSLPAPDTPGNLMQIGIVSRRAVEGKTTGDINARTALLESGPFIVESFKQGDRAVLRRNPAYFGEAPRWEQVTIRFISNDASRLAALLAGDVDFADVLPANDIPKIRANPKFAVWDGPSNRFMVLLINFRPDAVPDITDADGKPLPVNPLLDLRVRQALSKAIDRQVLVERVMDGAGVPSIQYAIPGMVGYDPNLVAGPADLPGVKALLTAAGYPNGFGLSVNCSNNRYPNDHKVCQAVAQMLTRAGFRAKVETMPVAMLIPMIRGAGEAPSKISLGMLGLGTVGVFPGGLATMVHSNSPAVGRGGFNLGRYNNPVIDRRIDEAIATLDPVLREQRTRSLMGDSVADVPILPLFFLKVLTAGRADLTYTTNTYEETLAWNLKPLAK